ncbi:hypothetical protein [Reinekea sp.]|jgi:hypothetical protein|uniref:hypothetical protein n=1 Tax=Reinekea sp. TaxID=1970455 RepID=UPI003989F5D7
MNRSLLLGISLALTSFIIGFILTLAVHWRVRPNADQHYLASDDALEQRIELLDDSSDIKTELKLAENTYLKLDEAHRIVEGRARALMSEMQVYKTSESQLLLTIEQQKEQLSNKIDKLDLMIESSLEANALAPQKTDYELAADITSLLAYPHSLNSFTELNQALQQQPRKNMTIVQARFEIMLQPEQYNQNDALYAALDRLMAKKEETTPNFSIENLFCSEQACEIQLKVGKPSPYFDSWRWLLDYLAQEPLLVSPTLSFSTDSGSSSESYGLIILTTR